MSPLNCEKRKWRIQVQQQQQHKSLAATLARSRSIIIEACRRRCRRGDTRRKPFRKIPLTMMMMMMMMRRNVVVIILHRRCVTTEPAETEPQSQEKWRCRPRRRCYLRNPKRREFSPDNDPLGLFFFFLFANHTFFYGFFFSFFQTLRRRAPRLQLTLFSEGFYLPIKYIFFSTSVRVFKRKSFGFN